MPPSCRFWINKRRQRHQRFFQHSLRVLWALLVLYSMTLIFCPYRQRDGYCNHTLCAVCTDGSNMHACAFSVHIRGVRILKYCVCIRLRILTTDPRLQAGAVSDPLSVRDLLSDHFPTSPSRSSVSNPSERGWDTEVQLTAAAAEHDQSRGGEYTRMGVCLISFTSALTSF